MKTISSRANPSFKSTLKLTTRKGREANNAFLAEGDILINEAIKSGTAIHMVFLRDDGSLTDEQLAGLLPAGLPAGAEVLLLPAPMYGELADTVTPQPLIAVLEKPPLAPLSPLAITEAARRRRGLVPSDPPPGNISVIVLDRLRDPGNAGTILRTADAAGFDMVITVKGTTDLYAPKVCRAAAGSVLRVPILSAGSAAEAAAALGEAGVKLVALDMAGTTCWDADITGDIALVVGNEGEGLQDDFASAAVLAVSIPMTQAVESLNAGVAASVVIYEKMRQDRRRHI